MKRTFLAIVFIIFLSLITTTSSYAISFFDNFDDGNADGWWLGYSQHTPWTNGNWRVENGVLMQDQSGDQFNALVENIQVSNQIIETQLLVNSPSGYGGITIWFQNDNNWVNVLIYPAANEVWVIERIDSANNLFRYPYASGANNTLYDLKVDADSTGGGLAVYINDVYLFTHTTITPYRNGQSGVNNGNAGGYFDNFNFTSSPTDKNQCKNNGWKAFNNPTFKNQGICVSYVISNEYAGKRQ